MASGGNITVPIEITAVLVMVLFGGLGWILKGIITEWWLSKFAKKAPIAGDMGMPERCKDCHCLDRIEDFGKCLNEVKREQAAHQEKTANLVAMMDKYEKRLVSAGEDIAEISKNTAVLVALLQQEWDGNERRRLNEKLNNSKKSGVSNL